MRVAIIGPGIMGRAIAIEFTKVGFKTSIFAKSASQAQKAKTLIQTKLAKIDSMEILDFLDFKHSLAELENYDLVIESITEDILIKQSLIREISSIVRPSAIIASNTSSLKIEKIFSDYPNKQNVIGIHFFNPPHKMSLVEISKTASTSKDTIDKVSDLITKLHKHPVIIYDSTGMMVNRLLIPYINHACELLEEKFTSIEAIDTAMTLGANHPIGPFKLADLIGIDVVVSILKNLHQDGKGPKPHKILEDMVSKNELGMKTGQGFYQY